MASGGLTTAVIFVWIMNIMMGLSQLSMNHIGTDTNNVFNGCGAIFLDYTDGNPLDEENLSIANLNNLSTSLPGGSETVTSTTGFIVLDWISSASNWIRGFINSFTEIVSGPYCMLNSIEGLDPSFVNQISIAWYAISILLLAAWIFGR